jgi:hypothetical protein
MVPLTEIADPKNNYNLNLRSPGSTFMRASGSRILARR